MHGDYARCASLIAEGRVGILQMHLMLISLHRLRSDDLVSAFGQKSLELVADNPWQTVLMKLTLGQATLHDALAIAATDHERVQAYFYCGTKQLSEGDILAGYKTLDLCLNYEISCPESWLAEIQKDWELETIDDLDPADHVAKHLAKAQDLLESLQFADALIESEKALTVAQSRFPVVHPQYLGALNTFAAVLLKNDRTSEAEEVLDAALEAVKDNADADPTLLATIMANRGWLFHTEHHDGNAIPLLQDAIRLREQTCGDYHVSVASASFQLACVFADLSRFADAETHLLRAARIYRDLAPEGSRESIATLEHLVTAYVEQRSFDKAADASAQLVRECEKLGEPEFLGYACYRRATILDGTSDHSAARTFYERAVSHLRQTGLPEHPVVARSLLRIAMSGDKVDTKTALHRYEEALPLFEKLVGCDNPDYVNGLMQYTLACSESGGARETLPALRKLRQLLETLHPPDHPETAMALELLAKGYLAIADIGSAVSTLTEAARILRKCSDHRRERLRDVLRNLANALARIASPTEALSVLEELRELQPETPESDPSVLSDTYNSFSGVYFQLGYFENATAAAKRCYELRLAALGSSHISTATAQHNLAAMLLTSGDASTSLTLIEDLLSRKSRLQAEDERLFAAVLTTAGGCYATLGLLDDAERTLQEAVDTELGVGGLDSLSLAHTYFELIALLLKRDQYASCVKCIARAGDLLTQAFAVNLLVGNEQRDYLLARIRALIALALYLALRKTEPCGGAPAIAWKLWSSWRAMTTDLSVVKKSIVSHAPESARLADELRLLRQELAGITFRGPRSSADLDAHRATLNDLEKRVLELERNLFYHEGASWRERYAEAFSANAAPSVPPGTAVIDFVVYEAPSPQDWPHPGPTPASPAYYAFVLAGGQDVPKIGLIDLGPCDRIERLIQSVRDEMSPPPYRVDSIEEAALSGRAEDDDLASNDLETLSELILRPLAEALQGCNKLLVIPDGGLWNLPLEILRLNDGECVLDRWEVSYLTNARYATEVAANYDATATREAVVVAGPDFNLVGPEIADGSLRTAAEMNPLTAGSDSSRLEKEPPSFSPLPGSVREGLEVASALGVRPWLGQDALDGRVKNLQGPLVLHIATHGFFVGGNMFRLAQQIGLKLFVSAADLEGGFLARLASQPPTIRSCLVLSGANTWLHGGNMAPDAEDGFLNAEEVSLMNLEGTELVFLSACETGLGEARIGEGLLGLAQAFCQAGARTCIVNLWKVSDEETTVSLVTEFYARLKAGASRSAALRSAKQFARQQGAEPRDWGGFVCLGAHDVVIGLAKPDLHHLEA